MTTLEEAKEALRAALMHGEAVECPVCTQLAKIYKRQINAGSARALIVAYRTYGKEYGHVPSLEHIARIGGEWAGLARWSLVEELQEKREDGGRAGWWRVTDLGERFVLDTLRVPKYVRIYDNRVLGHEGELVGIRDALGHTFDYTELMNS